MDFILHGDHVEHDADWTLYSTLHRRPVCLACIVETIENTELLPLQRKPALTEFQRLLTQQSAQLLQLFMKEERIVWHIVSILLESLNSAEETYLALTIEALLKLVLLIASEDLVTTVLDKTSLQVQATTDHQKLLPHYMLLGKVLYQLPAVAEILLRQYDWLVHELSLDLGHDEENVQSAIAYIFIFLCDGSQDQKLSARTLQQVHSGILKMLSAAQSLPVLVNGLGLTKKLIADDNGCRNLMTLTFGDVTFLSCMKKLLLSKKDVLQTGVSQILSLVLSKESYTEYVATVLESDIIEFLFESLHTENTVQIECILKVLQKLAYADQFYKRCHSVYGVESVLRALSTAFELKNPALLSHGYILLAEILKRHPVDIPLFLSSDLVQKCLSLIQQGLGHHQNAVSHTAQDAFLVVLRRSYLLSPVPFQQLSDMFSMVTRRKMEQMKSFRSLTEAKRAKNAEILIASLQRYLDLCAKSCGLLTQCRDDLASCESNFTAPGSQEGTSPMATFTELMFEESLMGLENCQLYIKMVDLFCRLFDLDDVKTCDLIYELISAGFLVNLIDVKVKYNSAQLREMTQQFLSISVDCFKKKSVLHDGSSLGDFLQEQHFKWSFSSVAQAFSDGNAEVESIEAYLAVLYMSCKCGDCGYSKDGLGDIVCSVLNGHVSLEQLSVIGKKHYIYLLSYVSVYEGIYVRQAIPHGLETLPQILQGPTADWYTHDMSILEWVFGDPILAGAAGQKVVEAFLDNTRLETMQTIFETEDCVECETILKLCQNKTFLRCIVTSMASSTSDNVSKISLCLEAYIGSVRQRNSLSPSSQELEELCAADHVTSDQVEFLFNKTAEVLQGVFLHHYSMSQDHNVGGLLQLLLLVMKAPESMFSVGVKVLYHVLNLLSRTQDDREELERTCMLTVLAAVTCTGESRNQAPVCAIVVQHEGFLGYLQQCVDKSKGGVVYCIGCDILGVLVQSKNVKCDGTVKMEIVKLLNSVCTEKGENQIASLNLLSALLSVNLASTMVSLTGRVLPSMYRSLYMQLQQACLQESVDIASSAVMCMRNLICYLHQSDTEMGKQLLCQPWNRMLLDVTLDLAASGNILDHHLTLLVLFTQFEDGCCLIKTSQGLLDKVIKVLQTASKDIQELCRMDYVTLMKQLLANFEDILTADDVKWLKENTDLLSETLERPELSTR